MIKSALLLAGICVYLMLRQCTSSPPTTAPSASPAPATPLPTPLVLASDAPPQILAVQMSDYVLHSGERISGTVVTSTNVTAVEIHLGGRTARLPQASPGVFSVSYRMPNIPFFMRGRYTGQIVALNAAGARAQRDISVTVALSSAPRVPARVWGAATPLQ